MAKFNRESNRSRGDGDKNEGEKKGGRSSYKAKRSFTRNKSSRDKQRSEPGGPSRRPFREREKSDRPFSRKPERERPFSREKPADRGDERRSKGFDRSGPREKDERSERVRSRERESRGGERGRDERSAGKPGSYRDRKPSSDREGERKERRTFNDRDDRPRSRDRDNDRRPSRESRDDRGGERRERPADKGDRPWRERNDQKGEERPSRFKARGDRDEDAPRRVKHSDFEEGRSFSKREEKTEKKSKPQKGKTDDDGLIRLNKYLANAGLASRREADTLIQSGAVKVNGVVVDQLGYKIKQGDKVTYGDETVKGERKVYLLLNKPKDYITTVDDPRDRKTVMELIQGACRERVYPVGRLDRNTTGLLLFTNDGELTTKLTHPKFGVKKVYHVTLDKNLKTTDFKALVDGIELEDGPARADDLAFVGEGKKEVGIEIHSGRNRIVRRMFEHLGYAVIKLDRVVFAGLTKKDLPRGKHRFLTPREVSFLKMIG